MTELIIYKRVDGCVSIITPILSCGLTIDQIAQKDVPTGLPYKIISASEVPADRTDRDLWTVDDSDLTDGVGGSQ